MLHETPICKFHRLGKVFHTSASEKIYGKVSNMRQGTVQIVCSTPLEFFDGVSLLRTFTIINPGRGNRFLIRFIRETSIFVPCSSKQLLKEIRIKSELKPHKISLCTASNRILENGFVEWIEYHRLIGIDHFFIYNTNISSSRLNGALTKYIDMGLVTLIHWPYSNCVKGMASGRWMQWNDTSNHLIYFRPPKAIAQSGALASCYSRYRKTSKYMVHIDDDEFIALNRSKQSKSSPGESLLQFVNEVFLKHPNKIAIGFRPVSKVYCPAKNKGKRSDIQETSSLLPRIGRWKHTECGKKFEQKLIMKTDSVRMFYIHYLSQVESRLGDSNKHTILLANITDVVLLHYRVPQDISGDVFGGQIVNAVIKEDRCSQYLLETGHEDNNNLNNNTLSEGPMIKRIPNELQELLKINYHVIMAQG
jgi:adenylate kinase family enzyme